MSGPTRKLTLAAVGFTLGLLWPWNGPGFWFRVVLVAVLFLILLVKHIYARRLHGFWAILLLVLWFALGMLRATPTVQSLPEGRLWIVGVVDVPVEQRGETNRIRLSLNSWQRGEVTGQLEGRALLTLYETAAPIPGETIRLAGELVPLVGVRNPGDFDERSYWRLRGVQARIIHAGVPEPLGVHGLGSRWQRMLGNMRQAVRDRLARHLGQQELPLAEALLLGDRSGWEEPRRDTLARSGLMHLFAISGLHTGLLAAILYAFLSLFTRNRTLVQLLTLLLLWLYVPFTGANPPVMRAAVILTLFMVGRILRRQNRLGYAMGLAWIGLLVWRPEGIHDVGFQLTFAGSLGAIYAGSLFKDLTKPGRAQYLPKFVRGSRHLRKTTLYTLMVSIGASLATAPLVILYFGRLPWLGPVATVVAAPLMTGVMISGWLTVFFDGIPLLGHLFGDALWGLLHLLDWVAGVSARWLPVSEFLPLTAAVAAGVVVLLLFAIGPRLRQSPLRGSLFALLLVAAGAIWTVNWLPANEVKLAVLDVGQGDGVLLRRGGRALVIDGGRSHSTAVERQLRLLGIKRIELLVLTHGDADHCGAAARFVHDVPVGAALVGPGVVRDESGRAALQALEEEGVPLFIGSAGLEVDLGDLGRVRLLAPPADIADSPSATDNELSLVTEWRGEGVSLLFPGDAGVSVERELVAAGTLPDVDLLLAGHHGSRHSTSSPWLASLNPEIVVVSAGRHNPYGHPSKEVLARFGEFGIQPYRTDQSGAVLFSLKGGRIRYLPQSLWW